MNIMTLSIAERANKRDYQIIGLNLDNQEILSLVGITKDNIINGDTIRWDIGAITTIDGINNAYGYEKSFSVVGESKLLKPFDKGTFLDILKKRSLGISNFFVNEREIFDIIKIVRLEDIIYKNKEHYIRVILMAKSKSRENSINEKGIMGEGGNCTIVELPIKDIRWVNYWNWAIKTGVYEEKRKVYRMQFNKSYHQKYAILFRDKNYYFSPRYLITGLHLL